MPYSKICTNCGKPFVSNNKVAKFCSIPCFKEYRTAHKKQENQKRHSVDKIYPILKAEWDEGDTAYCYLCGKKIDGWCFDYAYKHGRLCPKCFRNQKAIFSQVDECNK